MITPIDPGWMRTGDPLSKREQRNRRRSRKHNDAEYEELPDDVPGHPPVDDEHAKQDDLMV